jgi:hypothetical protein
MLAHYLDRLRHTLDTLSERLREAISTAVGETVAGVARETMRADLAELAPVMASYEQFFHPSHSSQPLWMRPEELEEEPWFDDPSVEEDIPPPRAIDSNRRSSRWPPSIAIGLHTTLWWLRRRVGKFPVMTAVSVGLLTAMATYAGGPLAAAAVGLAGSALGLLSIADTVRAVADGLSVCDSP